MKHRNFIQWWVYLDKRVVRLLKKIAEKELPHVHPNKRYSALGRKIFLEWLEWKGYLKKKRR